MQPGRERERGRRREKEGGREKGGEEAEIIGGESFLGRGSGTFRIIQGVGSIFRLISSLCFSSLPFLPSLLFFHFFLFLLSFLLFSLFLHLD